MTKKQELELYKLALIDWSKQIRSQFKLNTLDGFCHYFHFQFNINFGDLKTLPALGKQWIDKDGNTYFFESDGSFEKGRKSRIEALQKAIEILENELKTENHE